MTHDVDVAVVGGGPGGSSAGALLAQALALTEDLLTRVIAALGDQLRLEDRDPATLRARLRAGTGADPSLVRLSVTSDEPQQAQTIANTWARVYVAYANDLYQQRSSSALFFVSQAADAKDRLAATEQALVDFQAENPLNIVTVQLNSKQAELTNYLSATQTIALAIQDARGLQQQLVQQNVGDPSSLSDQIPALYLQVGALNAVADIPIQLQIGGEGSLSNRTASSAGRAPCCGAPRSSRTEGLADRHHHRGHAYRAGAAGRGLEVGVPERLLVTGLAPMDFASYSSQRLRWAEGNLKIIRRLNPLTHRGLTFAQRVCYFASMYHWTIGFPKLVFYLAPPLILFSGQFPIAHFDRTFVLMYLANLATLVGSYKLLARGTGRLFMDELFNMANFYNLLVASARILISHRASRFVVTSKRGGANCPL